MSALSLLSRGESKWFTVGDTDTVILSSHAIPGNEGNVNRVIDGLMRAGAKVVHSGIADVHATGHAQADELKTYHSILRPEWFVPVHGEFRHMRAHAELAVTMGADPDHVLQATDGDVLELKDDGLSFVDKVPANYLYVDGIVGDVGQGVLRDRRVLAEEGVVVIVATVDVQSRRVLTGPEIITRGWVYAPEADDLLDDAEAHVERALVSALNDGVVDIDALEREVRRAAGKFVNERTKRRPMIVPVVMTT
jgi:ribonuclease J